MAMESIEKLEMVKSVLQITLRWADWKYRMVNIRRDNPVCDGLVRNEGWCRKTWN